MASHYFTHHDASVRLDALTEIGAQARRATRWFPWFVGLQGIACLAFTLVIDLTTAAWWTSAAILLLVSIPLWVVALRSRRSAPRHGMRNMGIAVMSWFVLHTLMLDPALQLIGASSPWWWVLIGMIAVSPIAACLLPSSRR